MEQLNSRCQLKCYSASKHPLPLCVPSKAPGRARAACCWRECSLCCCQCAWCCAQLWLLCVPPQHGASVRGSRLQRGLQVLLPLQGPRLHHPCGWGPWHLRAHLRVSSGCPRRAAPLLCLPHQTFLTLDWFLVRHPYSSKGVMQMLLAALDYAALCLCYCKSVKLKTRRWSLNVLE